MVQTIAKNTVHEALKNVMQLRRHLAQTFLERDELIISTLISLVAVLFNTFVLEDSICEDQYRKA